MSILKVFAKLARIGETAAPAAIAAVNPTAGAITGIVLNAVIRAEQAGGSGAEKKEQVMRQVVPMVAPIVGTIMQASGSKVRLDPAGINQAISQTVDGVVALLNAIEEPASASASTTTAGTAPVT